MIGIYLDGKVEENAKELQAEESPLEKVRKSGRYVEMHPKREENGMLNIVTLRQGNTCCGMEENGFNDVSLLYSIDLLDMNQEMMREITSYLKEKGKPFYIADMEQNNILYARTPENEEIGRLENLL